VQTEAEDVGDDVEQEQWTEGGSDDGSLDIEGKQLGCPLLHAAVQWSCPIKAGQPWACCAPAPSSQCLTPAHACLPPAEEAAPEVVPLKQYQRAVSGGNGRCLQVCRPP